MKSTPKNFSKNRIIHGPYVRQKTYKKVIGKLKEIQTLLDASHRHNNKLTIALDGYYLQHNHYSQCACGYCDYARALIPTTYKPTLDQINNDAKFRASLVK